MLNWNRWSDSFRHGIGNVVLWQSDLRVSWRAQWISLLIHGLVSAVILLMPWPLSYTPLWMILLSLVVFDCVRSQRRINTCQGEIKLLMDGRLRWQGQDWTLLRPPWLLKSGMVLRLRAESGRHQHLWLAADSMEEAEWRELRRILLQQPISGQH
nr:protein YgfX [Salmonella enterica]